MRWNLIIAKFHIVGTEWGNC